AFFELVDRGQVQVHMDRRHVWLLTDQRRGDPQEVAEAVASRRKPVGRRWAHQLVVRLRLIEQLLFVEIGAQTLVVQPAYLCDSDQPALDDQVGNPVGLLVHNQPLDRAQTPPVSADNGFTETELPHLPSSPPPASGLTSMRLRASSRRCSQILR